MLDYSRVSRHLLATAGDDGSLHLWDTTGRSPKASWVKQHSAPTAGLSFSPSNDKIIASVGLDKKLYTFDSGMRKSTFCISYEAPFSSLAFRDDGWILAAGTSNGRVVFYDVRGKPQPFTVLRAYGNSEAVTGLCWQRLRPIAVNDRNCTAEVALLGGSVEDSVLMPDPLPSATSSNVSQTTNVRSSSSAESSSFTATVGEPLTDLSSGETPRRNSLFTGGKILPRLHATRTCNFKDDMDVFSPIVDVEPITPSLDKLWNEPDESRKDQTISSLFPNRKFSHSEGVNDVHPIFDWKPSTVPKQDGIHSVLHGSPSSASSRTDDSSSISPPEAWGGETLSDKFALLRQKGSLSSRFSLLASGNTTASTFAASQDLSSTSQSSMGYSSGLAAVSASLSARDISCGLEISQGIPGHVRFSRLSQNLGSKFATSQANVESTGVSSLNFSRRFPTYAGRMSTTASFTDAVSASVGSPKTKKTGVETREQNNLLSISDTSTATEAGLPSANVMIIQAGLPSANGPSSPHQKPSPADLQEGTSSFTLQLFQRTLDEMLGSFQKSIHEDVRNLHIEILRQFHIQEMDMSSAINTILDNQAALLKEVRALKKENERLRQLL